MKELRMLIRELREDRDIKQKVIAEYLGVRRHIVGGANRTLISAITSLRSCGIGTCRRLSSG